MSTPNVKTRNVVAACAANLTRHCCAPWPTAAPKQAHARGHVVFKIQSAAARRQRHDAPVQCWVSAHILGRFTHTHCQAHRDATAAAAMSWRRRGMVELPTPNCIFYSPYPSPAPSGSVLHSTRTARESHRRIIGSFYNPVPRYCPHIASARSSSAEFSNSLSNHTVFP